MNPLISFILGAVMWTMQTLVYFILASAMNPKLSRDRRIIYGLIAGSVSLIGFLATDLLSIGYTLGIVVLAIAVQKFS